MNNVVIIGRMTSDPSLAYTQSGKAYAKFTLAVDRKFKNKLGEKETDFINVMFWEKTAEIAGEYLRKGHRCGVIGEIRTGSYEDKEGKKVRTFEVLGNQLQLLENAKSNTDKNKGKEKEFEEEKKDDSLEDDFPFN